MAKEQKTEESKDQSQETPALTAMMQKMQEQSHQIESLTQKLQEQESKEQKQQQAQEQTELQENRDLSKLLAGLDDDAPAEKKTVDELSNRELVGVISDVVEKFVGSNLTNLKNEITEEHSGFLQKLENTERSLGLVMAKANYETVKSQYPDFEQYKTEIAMHLKEVPGLDIERAYLLAKAADASKTPSLRNTESEHPGAALGPSSTPESNPRRRQDEQGTERKSGLSGFRSMLDDALDRTVQ